MRILLNFAGAEAGPSIPLQKPPPPRRASQVQPLASAMDWPQARITAPSSLSSSSAPSREPNRVMGGEFPSAFGMDFGTSPSPAGVQGLAGRTGALVPAGRYVRGARYGPAISASAADKPIGSMGAVAAGMAPHVPPGGNSGSYARHRAGMGTYGAAAMGLGSGGSSPSYSAAGRMSISGSAGAPGKRGSFSSAGGPFVTGLGGVASSATASGVSSTGVAGLGIGGLAVGQRSDSFSFGRHRSLR
jgi:hypothetical protein